MESSESANPRQAQSINFGNAPPSRVLTEDIIPLLEERLIVELTQRKVGEIVVRKEIESHVLQVQVPVRREKLIVEQISPEYKLLAEVDLGQYTVAESTAEFVQAALVENSADTRADVRTDIQGSQSAIAKPFEVVGTVNSPEDAVAVLSELTKMPSSDFESIKIELSLKDTTRRDIYQKLFEHHQQL